MTLWDQDQPDKEFVSKYENPIKIIVLEVLQAAREIHVPVYPETLREREATNDVLWPKRNIASGRLASDLQPARVSASSEFTSTSTSLLQEISRGSRCMNVCVIGNYDYMNTD